MTRANSPSPLEEGALLERAKSFAREENLKVIKTDLLIAEFYIFSFYS